MERHHCHSDLAIHMGKLASDIIEWGAIKPPIDKKYSFNTIDIETIENELFLLGYTTGGNYRYTLKDFYNTFNNLIISSIRTNSDILTWTRYDNTHLLKMLLSGCKDVSKVLLRIGKLSPIYQYQYKDFSMEISNIIKDSMIMKVTDRNEKSRTCIIYNLKNLFTSDLLTTAGDYGADWYSKLDESYHIIDRQRFETNRDYRGGVILSNRYDNAVLPEIAMKFLENFKSLTGTYPKTIFTAGSIARAYLMAYSTKGEKIALQFRACFPKSKKRDKLLDYSMRSYHGGKIESYVIGSIKQAKIIDISSAYPSVLARLPKLKRKIITGIGVKGLEKYYYAFIHCDIEIANEKLIHPLVYENPLNRSNVSPYGFLKDMVITKPEYDYMMRKGAKITVYDYMAVESDATIYPYKNLITDLFNRRLVAKKEHHSSLADLIKTIINAIYGIHQELTDVYEETEKGIEWIGYRAGDFFNSIISSYITAETRTYLSDVSTNIIENGGEVYLNMTDSILYDGTVTLDVFSETKTLGKFEMPENLENIIVMGAGRYEYKNEFTKKYTIKSRGFSVSIKDKSFYSGLDLNGKIKIKHKTFVSSFRATTKKFDFAKMGHLIDDAYEINPLNLGGKRIIIDRNVNLNKGYTKTKAVYIEKDFSC